MSWTTTTASIATWSSQTYTEDAAARSVRTNYFTDSGEPWNPRSWRDGTASRTTGGTLAPDGTEATKLTRISGNGNCTFQVPATIGSAGTKTFSVYAKAGTAAAGYVQFLDGTDGRFQFVTCYFGTTPPSISFSGTGGGISAALISAQTIGDDWYRFGLSIGSVTPGDLNAFYLFPDLNTGAGSYTYFWGAQAEDGDSMTTYIPTTDAVGVAMNDRWIGDSPSTETWSTLSAP